MNNEITPSTMSFDRMRTMLVRAAEIRESEQQQVFDALDEIHARLSPLESLGSMRKRLSDMPDRAEIGVLAERLDETVSKLDAQDSAIAALGRAVESVVDKLAKPFAQLDGRLEGVAGRFEGVAGRMDGLEDKLSNIHRRLDELDLHLDKQDNKVDALPREINANTRDRMDAFDSTLTGRMRDMETNSRDQLAAVTSTISDASASLGATRDELVEQLGAQGKELQTALSETAEILHAKIADTHGAATDTTHLDLLGERLDNVAGSIEAVTARLEAVESDFGDRFGELSASVRSVREEVGSRPDVDALDSLIRKANNASEQRNAGQLDEAMATFAELILGGGSQEPQQTLPKQQARRRSTKPRVNGASQATPPQETEDSTV